MQRLFISVLSLAAFAPAARAQSAPDPQPSADATAHPPADTAQPSSEPAVASPGAPSDTPPPASSPANPNPPPAGLPAPTPAEAKVPQPAVTAKWDMSLYGFIELDSAYDSVQGFNDLAGNAAIARPGSFAGNNDQFTMSARNTRIGYRVSAPTYHDMKASAQLELDFFGNQPTPLSEAAFFQNAALRTRHANLKIETPYVDVLFGQYWELFGWQSYFHPNTVELQGVPGQVYSRTPQIRVSKKIKAGDISVEMAIAALRPPQRASGVPDGQAGLKLNIDAIKAYHTAGGTGTSLDSASVGVSVIGRKFQANEFTAAPAKEVSANGYGISIDALIPVIPATKERKANALSVTGSFVTGAGIADQYTGLSGGVSEPALPNPTGKTPPPTYTPNIDNGLALFTKDGQLHPIQWTSYIVGLQYYLPPSGKVWLSGVYSHMSSGNDHAFGDKTKIFEKSDWVEGNVFVDVTPAWRLGAEYAYFHQDYAAPSGDGSTAAKDHRVQLSAWLIF
ncbi:MAG TPA: hypothetical protein VFP84_34850 [Kofleriaceae bacterium]|nr:hypothetical protein [Kofleriaceae bacterium]